MPNKNETDLRVAGVRLRALNAALHGRGDLNDDVLLSGIAGLRTLVIDRLHGDQATVDRLLSVGTAEAMEELLLRVARPERMGAC